MSLQDVENLDGAVAEASRVLRPGGRFCLAVVHPLTSAGEFETTEVDSPFAIPARICSRRTTPTTSHATGES